MYIASVSKICLFNRYINKSRKNMKITSMAFNSLVCITFICSFTAQCHVINYFDALILSWPNSNWNCQQT